MNSDQAQVLSGMQDEDFFRCVIPEMGDRSQVWAELPTDGCVSTTASHSSGFVPPPIKLLLLSALAQ